MKKPHDDRYGSFVWLDRRLGDREHVGSASMLGEPGETADEQLDRLDDEPDGEEGDSAKWSTDHHLPPRVLLVRFVLLPDFRWCVGAGGLVREETFTQPVTEVAEGDPRNTADDDERQNYEIMRLHDCAPLVKGGQQLFLRIRNVA